jgi:hypothetical protein
MNGNHDVVYSMMQFCKDLKNRHNKEILCGTDKVQLKAKHNVASVETSGWYIQEHMIASPLQILPTQIRNKE